MTPKNSMKIAPRQVITTHLNTDFDALASVIGASLLYPDAVGVIPKMVNNNVSKFLSTHKSAFELYLPNEVEYGAVDKLILVDTDQWHRLDRMKHFQDRDDITVDIWDHHTKNPGNIDAGFVCKEGVGATVTLIVREMKKRNMSLSPLESTVLLLGLYEDTGHLSFTSTTPEDAHAAAFLLENGADLNVASFFLRPPYEEQQKEILFELLKTTEKITINGRKIGFNIVKLDKKITNLASVINTYRGIVNVAAVFVLFINEAHCTVIARSGSPAIDVGQIMRAMGGGGHSGAASATLRDKHCQGEQIRDDIISSLKNEITHHAQMVDLMSFPVVTTTPSTPMKDVRELMDEKNVRGVVVMEGDSIEGMLVLHDFRKIKKDNQWQSPAKAFMARNIITTTPDTPPFIAAELMSSNSIGYLPVVHEEKMIGIVTRTDLLNFVYGLVPE